VIFFWFNQFTY